MTFEIGRFNDAFSCVSLCSFFPASFFFFVLAYNFGVTVHGRCVRRLDDTVGRWDGESEDFGRVVWCGGWRWGEDGDEGGGGGALKNAHWAGRTVVEKTLGRGRNAIEERYGSDGEWW